MRKSCGGQSLMYRLLCFALIAGGVLLLLIFVPYRFWVALLGLLLAGCGLLLLKL